jgi:hypothetical protein
MIQTLQQELVDIAALKAGVIWREKGERSADYLKAIHQQRTAQRYIPSLRDCTVFPRSNTIETNTNNTDIQHMKSYAQQFYQALYTADLVSKYDIESYLNGITFERTLDCEEQDEIMLPIDTEELIEQATRTTKTSSPGSDGLSYPYLNFLFNLSPIKNLVKLVYNEALKGQFPDS